MNNGAPRLPPPGLAMAWAAPPAIYAIVPDPFMVKPAPGFAPLPVRAKGGGNPKDYSLENSRL
jgi:hypothetical protein